MTMGVVISVVMGVVIASLIWMAGDKTRMIPVVWAWWPIISILAGLVTSFGLLARFQRGSRDKETNLGKKILLETVTAGLVSGGAAVVITVVAMPVVQQSPVLLPWAPWIFGGLIAATVLWCYWYLDIRDT